MCRANDNMKCGADLENWVKNFGVFREPGEDDQSLRQRFVDKVMEEPPRRLACGITRIWTKSSLPETHLMPRK